MNFTQDKAAALHHPAALCCVSPGYSFCSNAFEFEIMWLWYQEFVRLSSSFVRHGRIFRNFAEKAVLGKIQPSPYISQDRCILLPEHSYIYEIIF